MDRTAQRLVTAAFEADERARDFLARNASALRQKRHPEGYWPDYISDISFGFSIGTATQDLIETNAEENGIELTNEVWDQLNRDIAQLERNLVRALVESGFSPRPEGHGDNDLVGSAWITREDGPKREFAVKLLLDVSETEPVVSSSSGRNMLDFELSTAWANISETGQCVLDFAVFFFDTEEITNALSDTP